ncbi:MAG TPA: Ig-like domain-containing protein [Micromonosporaceae bacterium]|nr:Ig-like domain-containing protein [Micromonosporaceae bacterium]
MRLTRPAVPLLAVLACLTLVLASCTSNPVKRAVQKVDPPVPKVAIQPTADAKNVPVSAEIAAAVTDGKLTTVTVKDAKGAKLSGSMRPDGSSWIPDRPLTYKQKYTAEVTATNDHGKTTTQSASFTTMAKPANQTQVTYYFQNNAKYGVAMPVPIAFDPPVPKEARAGVQHRLFVTTSPSQPGVWHWLADGSQAYYRAPEMWRPGTKISVRAALEGVPMGQGSYGAGDFRGTATVGDKVTLDVDNRTKQISVYRNDRLARKIPVSLGKSSTPSSSGKMVIMEKHETTVFDTRGSPDPYVVTVSDAQRLTWGGEFVHSAPWSVGDQGNTNVSHGCANVSPENAAYLMKVTHVGDLVTVRGTEAKLDPGNGWTAWDMSWEQYIKGSALPVPEELKRSNQKAGPKSGGSPAPSGTPSANGSPSAVPSNGGP